MINVEMELGPQLQPGIVINVDPFTIDRVSLTNDPAIENPQASR
jgi:hypothetical protein